MIISGKPPFDLFEDLVEEYLKKLKRLKEHASIKECVEIEVEHLNAVHEVYENFKANAFPLQFAIDQLFIETKKSVTHEVDMHKFWESELMQHVKENIQSRYIDKPEVLHNINELLSSDKTISNEELPDLFKKLSMYMENSLDSNLYHELAFKIEDPNFKARWLEGNAPAARLLYEAKDEIVKDNKVFSEIISKSINELSDTNKHKNGLLSIDHIELAKNHSTLAFEHLQISEELSNAIKAANTLDKKCKGNLLKTKEWTYDNGIFHFEHVMALGSRSILYDLDQKKIRIEETEVAKSIQQKENEEKAQRSIKVATRSYIDSLTRDYKKDPSDNKKIIPAGILKQDADNRIEKFEKTANLKVVKILSLNKELLSADMKNAVEKIMDKIKKDEKEENVYKNLSTQEIKDIEKYSKYVKETAHLEPNYEKLKEKVEAITTVYDEKITNIKNDYDKIVENLNSLLTGSLKMSTDSEKAIEKMCILDFENPNARAMAEAWIKNPANAQNIKKMFEKIDEMDKLSESKNNLNLSEIFKLKERKVTYKEFAKGNKEYVKTLNKESKAKQDFERVIEDKIS